MSPIYSRIVTLLTPAPSQHVPASDASTSTVMSHGVALPAVLSPSRAAETSLRRRRGARLRGVGGRRGFDLLEACIAADPR
eukprot:16767-Amorphochlora_amoeboformis.AAC.2